MTQQTERPGAEVPREEWVAFFERFGQQHAGWFATVEVTRPDGHSLAEVHGLPVAGASARLGPQASDEIALVLQWAPDAYVTHTVTAPMRVTWTEAGEQWPPTIRIEARSGGVTRIEARQMPGDLPARWARSTMPLE